MSVELYKQTYGQTWQEIVQPSLGGLGSDISGVPTSGGGQQYYYPEIYGGQFIGGTFKTNDSGARLEIFPDWDKTIGMIVYNAVGTEIFKIEVDGVNSGKVTVGNTGLTNISFISDTLNTSAKAILKDFNFASTDYSGAFKAGDITWNATTGAITGGSGVVMYKNGIVAASNGVTTMTLPISGSPTFAGTLTAASIIVGTAASIVETGTLANFPSDTNLVGYWAFDEGTGAVAYDNSGGGKTGIINGNPTWVAGMAGKALDFDGTGDFVNIAGNIGDLTAGFTLSMWINNEASGVWSPIITRWDGAVDGQFQLWISNANKVWLDTWDSTGTLKSIKSNESITFNEWIKLTITWDGATVKFFINDTELTYNGSNTLASLFVTTLQTSIGRRQDNGYYFNGKIDEVRIYNTALTAAQAYALYKYPSGNSALVKSGVSIIDGTITAPKISTTTLSAIVADLGSITAGNITLDTSGFIRGGQTAFDTGANGFWFGYVSSAWKFSMAATATERLTLDSTGITISAKLNKLAGDILYQSADTGRNSGASPCAYQLKKSIKIYQPGTYRVKFTMSTGLTDGYGQVCKNAGTPVGTERYLAPSSGDTVFSEDLAFASGDTVELWLKATTAGGYYATVSNFRLYVSQYDFSQVVTD